MSVRFMFTCCLNKNKVNLISNLYLFRDCKTLPELPATAGPAAGEGFLPGVAAHVCLQVGGLGVEFAAARMLTLEHLVLLLDVGLGGCVAAGDAGAVREVILVRRSARPFASRLTDLGDDQHYNRDRNILNKTTRYKQSF